MHHSLSLLIASLPQDPKELTQEQTQAIYQTIELLDQGVLRVCEKATTQEQTNGQETASATKNQQEQTNANSQQTWTTHEWIKKAILWYFRLQHVEKFEMGPFVYFDKIPLKKNFDQVRVVPPAVARYGSFIEPAVVLMPSYVNIGARVGQGSMVDTWATVGSCAQIGKNVHLSGGVGIGGVLEPLQAQPVIIEDGAFIGSRAIIVEGVHIGKEAVIAANVTLTASTPIIDTRSTPFQTIKGYVPPRCVVVPGVREKDLPGGKIYLSCAYIMGERKASTDLKTSLNDVLREFSIQV